MWNVSDLQLAAADTGRPSAARENPGLQAPLAKVVWTSDVSTSYQLNARCQNFITRYLGRSLITPDDPIMIQVNRKLLELAFAVSFVTINIVSPIPPERSHRMACEVIRHGLELD